ncbi:hypothetical protein DFH09DRAFT_1458838 [Mycena vulgaris]|nr:hypothetical protein DFH09DRAFT_1458838 [Mycena vulgaris]
MRFKFNSPTYAGYPEIDSQIATCVQPGNPSVSQAASTFGIDMCGAIMECVMNGIDNRFMSFYSAAATILGFIPTILSMIGTSRDDYLKIHKRFPILALLLSFCNPSTVVAGLAWRTNTPPEAVLLINHGEIESYRGGIYIPAALHVVATAAAALVIWQAVLLGIRGVVSFSCPTWENPLIWVLLGPAGHVIDVLVSRCCITPPHRWRWHLSTAEGLQMRWPWVMRLKDISLTTLALADYVYGTVILSSMQLVGPRPALEITMFFVIPAIFARLISIFILELGPGEYRRVLEQEKTPRGPEGIPMVSVDRGSGSPKDDSDQ